MASSSSALQQPFSYLDTTCILWCSKDSTIQVQDFLSHLPQGFLASFTNDCNRIIELWRNHWKKFDRGGLSADENAVVNCLRVWPIPADTLVSIMQVYNETKYHRGPTQRGIIDFRDGPATQQAYRQGALELYNKIFSITERENHRKQREADAGLTPLQRPHPGLERVRTNHHNSNERRKKRKFGDGGEKEGEVDSIKSMRKMKKDLPTLGLGGEGVTSVAMGKQHEGLVLGGKGKDKAEDDDESE